MNARSLTLLIIEAKQKAYRLSRTSHIKPQEVTIYLDHASFDELLNDPEVRTYMDYKLERFNGYLMYLVDTNTVHCNVVIS